MPTSYAAAGVSRLPRVSIDSQSGPRTSPRSLARLRRSMSRGGPGPRETELRRRTDVSEHTHVAAWRVRDADASTVQVQTEAQTGPFARRDDAAHVVLDLHRIGCRRESELLREPRHVRVHSKSRHAECDTEHHVGGLASDPAELNQILHPRRHLAVVTQHK